VACHQAVDRARSEQRRREVMAEAATLLEEGLVVDGERTLQAQEDLQRLTAVVLGLPEPNQPTFLLNCYHGMPERDIAALLGVSKSLVAKHIRRALQRMIFSLHPSSRLSRKARDWVALLASGECSQQDIAHLREWLASKPESRSAFDHHRRLWNALGGAHELVLSACPNLLDAPSPAVRWNQWWRLPAWKVVGLGMALLVACVFAPTAWIALQADVRTGSQQHRQTVGLWHPLALS